MKDRTKSAAHLSVLPTAHIIVPHWISEWFLCVSEPAKVFTLGLEISPVFYLALQNYYGSSCVGRLLCTLAVGMPCVGFPNMETQGRRWNGKAMGSDCSSLTVHYSFTLQRIRFLECKIGRKLLPALSTSQGIRGYKKIHLKCFLGHKASVKSKVLMYFIV